MIVSPLIHPLALSISRSLQSRGADSEPSIMGSASLSLDFVRGDYLAKNWGANSVSRVGLPSIMTTTRASGGSYFDHLGVFQWAANNTPRIDHDPATLSTSTSSVTLASGPVTLATTVTYTVGSYVRATYDGSNWMAGRVTASTGSSVTLWVDRVVGSGTFASWTVIRVRGLLIEESRTNLLTYSSDFANAGWSRPRSTVLSSVALSPTGELTASKLVEDSTASSTHFFNKSIPVTAGSVYTLSGFFKAAERAAVRLNFQANGFGALIGASFDLNTGAPVTASPGIIAAVEHVGGGFYRCSITATATVTATTTCEIRLALADGATIYTGDGTSGVYIWGAQLEAGAFPTSYIPTTTAQVTRAADVASVNELSPWYNPEQGTLFAEAVNQATSGQRAFCTVDDGTVNNRIELAINNGGSGRTQVTVGGVSVADINGIGTSIARGGVGRMSAAFAAGHIIAALNGTLSVQTAMVSIPAVTKLVIGSRSSIPTYFNGHIRSIRYFPRALTNTELQEITA